MANTIIQADAPDGLTLTLKLYAVNGDTIQNGASGDTLTEKTNNKGTYTATLTEALVGVHEARITNASDQSIAKYVTEVLVDDTGTYECHDTLPAAVAANMIQISGDSTAADNLELQYDTTGLTGDTYPATQAQLGGIANVGSAVHKTPATYTLTTGTQSSGTIASVAALDGVSHEHTDAAGVLLIEYHHLIGSGTPSAVQITGYVSGSNDTVLVAGYDWVAGAYVQIGSIEGQNGTPSPLPVHSFDLFVDMVGSGANEGKVDIKVYATSGLTSSTTRIDQIFVAFSQGVEGYDNGAVWLDTNHTNGNTEVGIDGVARNPVSTVADCRTMLASTNLHHVQVAPNSSFTLAATTTNEVWEGRDWTIALGGQDISGTFVLGAVVSGIATATTRYEFEECEILASTMGALGLFERCSLGGTFTIGEAGVYTFHLCFNESGSEVTIDFAAIGATTVHMFAWDGEVNFTNMAAGDFVHITGAGTITTTTCTGGTIEHDGFFEYTDAGGNVTEQQSDIKVAVDAVLVDTAAMSTTTQTAVDAALDTAIAELSVAAPTATPTVRTGLMLLYMALRNKLVVQTSGTDALEVYNNAGTKIASKLITDDGSDYTEAEMS